MLKHLGILLMSTLFFTVANARDKAKQPLDLSIHESYRSLRAMSMGGAFSAIVDDHTAMLYNPAALARRKDGVIYMGIGGGFSDNFVSFADDVSNAGDAQTDDEKRDQMINLLENNYGKNFNLNFPRLGGFWARPNWGIAVIPVDTSVNIAVNRNVGPALNINVYNDTTIAYGWARDLETLKRFGNLSVGVTGKLINRVYYGQTIVAADAATNDPDYFSDEAAAEGLTFDLDLGLLFDPNIGKGSWLNYIKPTFSAVLRNALDYGFTQNLELVSSESVEPPKLQRRLDLGAKLDVPGFWVFDPNVAIDFRNIMHDNWSLKKGLHIGAELKWEMFSWWKGTWGIGLNQGYYTAGLGARFGFFKLDVVTYGEEVGTDDHNVEDRRYMLEMSLEF